MASGNVDAKRKRQIKKGAGTFIWIKCQAAVMKNHLRELETAWTVIDAMDDHAERRRAIVEARNALDDLEGLRFELDRTINECREVLALG
jgi:hypothetical protein